MIFLITVRPFLSPHIDKLITSPAPFNMSQRQITSDLRVALFICLGIPFWGSVLIYDWLSSYFYPPDSRRKFPKPKKPKRNDGYAASATRVPVFQTSSFLLLPPEIRLMIYEHVFSDQCVIYLTPKRRGRKNLYLSQMHTARPTTWEPGRHIRSPIDPVLHPEETYRTIHECRHTRRLGRIYCDEKCPKDHWYSFLTEKQDRMPVGLLLTSRLIYQESVHIFYNSLTFDFSTLGSFLYFTDMIPKHALSSIANLQLRLGDINAIGLIGRDGVFNLRMMMTSEQDILEKREAWARTWGIIKNEMTGLRQLYLGVGNFVEGLLEEQSWLQNVEQLRGLKQFRLVVGSQWYNDRWLNAGTKEYRTRLEEMVKRSRS